MNNHDSKLLLYSNHASPIPLCDNSNKWSKKFEERPHRRLVTPGGGDWVRPTLTLYNARFLGPRGTDERDQQTDRQTDTDTILRL